MSHFDFCVRFVFEREGGFVNHPRDRGGATNFGITKNTLSRYRGVTATVEDVKALTRDEAETIYRLRYWNPMRLDRVRSRSLALILFDQGVNRGTKSTIMQLQKVLNEHFNERLEVDGVLGNKTDVAVSTAPESRLIRKLLQAAMVSYAEICRKNPSQLVFLKGWLNRVFHLWETVSA